MPRYKYQHFGIGALMLVSLLSIACSNNSSSNSMNQPTFPKHLLGESDSQYDVHLSEEEKSLYSDASDAFYNFLFEKGVTDDSSFCGFYAPRLITKHSILPRYKCSYDDNRITILSFAINGFYLSIEEIGLNKPTNDKGEILFYNMYGEECSDYLIPFVFFRETHKICSIKEAYIDRTISQTIFTRNKGNNDTFFYTFNATLSLISPLRKDYYVNLPPLVDYPKTTQSLLRQELQDIKLSFYKKEIEAKALVDDKSFRESYVGTKYNYYYIELDETSIHIDFCRSFLSGLSLYFISINDIKIDRQAWFDDPIAHEYCLGNNKLTTLSTIEPIVKINEDIYNISDSFKQGLLTNQMLEELLEAYPNGNMTEDSCRVEIETKTLERITLHNKVAFL